MDNALTNELLNKTIQLENESLIYFKSLGLKKLSKKAFPVLTLNGCIMFVKDDVILLVTELWCMKLQIHI